MSLIHTPQLLTTKEEISTWLMKHKIDESSFDINNDLTVSAGGAIHLSSQNITHIPFQFKDVDGDFVISHNKLTTILK